MTKSSVQTPPKGTHQETSGAARQRRYRSKLQTSSIDVSVAVMDQLRALRAKTGLSTNALLTAALESFSKAQKSRQRSKAAKTSPGDAISTGNTPASPRDATANAKPVERARSKQLKITDDHKDLFDSHEAGIQRPGENTSPGDDKLR